MVAVVVLNCNAPFISCCGFIGVNLIQVNGQNAVIVTKRDFLNVWVRMYTFRPNAFSDGCQGDAWAITQTDAHVLYLHLNTSSV